MDRIFQTLQLLKDKSTPNGSTSASTLVVKKISEIHQVVMPGAWPGSTVSVTPGTGAQAQRKTSVPKALSPLNASAKGSIKENKEAASVASPIGAGINGKDSQQCTSSEIQKNDRKVSLTSSAVGSIKGRISARGSITSVGAVLAGATLAASSGSHQVSNQLVSPNGSMKRKNSKQTNHTSTAKGILDL